MSLVSIPRDYEITHQTSRHIVPGQYYRARYYDAVLKRFVSEDPIGLAGGINAFAYVDGDPVSFSDALGLQGGTNPTFDPNTSQAIEPVYPEIVIISAIRGPAIVRWFLRCPPKEPPAQTPPKPFRKHPRELRKAWEKENNQPWPKTDTGRNYDAHHKKPLADGGTNDPSNIEPMHPRDHRQHHIDNGDFKRWGGRSDR